jgi:hypothetical protein
MPDKKKELKETLRKSEGQFRIDGFDMKWRGDSFFYYRDKAEIAQIGFAFLSEKHAELGALFGVYIGGSVNAGVIPSALSATKISYPPKSLPVQYFYRSSLEYTNFQNLPKNGILSVFSWSDLTSINDVLVEYATGQILSDIKLYLSNSPSLSDRIFAHPDWFRYPALQIVYNAMTNSTMSDDILMQKLKDSKIYGSRDKQVEEAIAAVKEILKA